MGWQLAEEVAAARPERPGLEWWTLMDIAQDARDETRRGMPGHAYLMARAKCSRATLYRRIKVLTDAGYIRVARKSAPDRRAIYEIAILHGIPELGLITNETRSGLADDETRCGYEDDEFSTAGLTEAEMRSGLTIAETRTEEVIHNGSQNDEQRVSKSGERVSLLLTPTPSVTPSVLTRHTPKHLLTSPSVEGSGGGEVNGGISFTSDRDDLEAERRRQADLLTAWEQDQPAAAVGQNGARP
jgi:hypothetical protein